MRWLKFEINDEMENYYLMKLKFNGHIGTGFRQSLNCAHLHSPKCERADECGLETQKLI